MNCPRCVSGVIYNQPQLDGVGEMKCIQCGFNASLKPQAPRPIHPNDRGARRYEPRVQGQSVSPSTVERNKYYSNKISEKR